MSKKTAGAKKEASIKNQKSSVTPVHIPKTVQSTIPYVRVYDDHGTNGGIIEVRDGKFTKSYFLDDANYSDVGEEKQEEILRVYEKILNTFNHTYSYEITINNRTIEQEQFNRSVLINYQNDNYDDLRREHNDILLDKMQEGKNNLKAEKYLTVGVEAKNIREALDLFANIEKDLNVKFKRINMNGLKAISLKGRLEILHDIYNIGQEGDFSRYFDLENIIAQGITTKDAIGPASFDFSKNDRIQIGNMYARALFLKSVPATLSSNLLESLTSISTNILLSVHYEAQPQEKAVSFASGQVTSVGGEVVKAQKSLSKSGASTDLISPKLATAQKDAKEMLADLTDNNQKLFHVTIVAVVFAQNEDDLKLYTDQVKTRAKEHVCQVEVLQTQQEQGLNSALPLASNYIRTHRIMTSETASAIQPFSTQELQLRGGFYYGLNQLSKNLIVYNRAASNNQNGIILGSPGAGKSFSAKMEMYQAFLNTMNSQIFIIDPEREYIVLAKRLGGKVFSIEPGGKVHINPMDLDITKGDDGDPFAQKVDYVISIVERMLGGKTELNGYAKSIIDNTLQELYAPYIEQLEKRGKTIDIDICPTLKDFYYALTERKEAEARNLASSIRMYCDGTLDLFSYHTNVDTNSRFIVYDISHIGTNLQELGMQICLNDIWNRMITNKKRSVRTWFYIDEMHLLLKQPSSASYLQMVWKRARKWMGTPTGITQNVEDLLNSTEGNTILSTSDFALMLSQSPLDRAALAAIYNISDEQQEYFTNVGSGEGLIYTSRTIVPFENRFPNDTELYKILSTKPTDSEAVSAPS
jgi:hypothetical protein